MWPRVLAILRQRCPVCLTGPMFQGRITMYPDCPACGHHFTREPGFFQGAMYVSYGLGVLLFSGLLLLFLRVLRDRFGLLAAILCTIAVYLLCVPLVFRYSRVIWAHLNVGTRQA
jgi:uncharacterized protein (DUF983 family)